jgi:hypothetical protein
LSPARPACRRPRSFARAPDACFFNRWPRLSETARVWAEAGINALEHGASRCAAAVIADRTLLRHLRETEGLPHILPRGRLWRRMRVEEGPAADSMSRTRRSAH